MNEKYILVNFKDLQEGQMVVSFGTHVARWNFDLMGDPSYAFVPEEDCEYCTDFDDNGDPITFTSCGHEFGEKEFVYCPYCGRKLKEVNDGK